MGEDGSSVGVAGPARLTGRARAKDGEVLWVLLSSSCLSRFDEVVGEDAEIAVRADLAYVQDQQLLLPGPLPELVEDIRQIHPGQVASDVVCTFDDLGVDGEAIR